MNNTKNDKTAASSQMDPSQFVKQGRTREGRSYVLPDFFGTAPQIDAKQLPPEDAPERYSSLKLTDAEYQIAKG